MSQSSENVERPRWPRRELNPLLAKELRGQMRGARAFVVLTAYLLILSCVAAVIYASQTVDPYLPVHRPDMAALGKAIFASVVLMEIFPVTFVAPALTSGAISGERERKTYDLLRTTLLSARALVVGKLASAVMYLLLLILAAVPLEGLAFVLGGVVIEELVLALVILVVTALAFSAIGLVFSAFSRTTRGATGLAYATTVTVTVVLPILLAIVATVGLALVVPGSDGPGYSWGVQAVLIYLLYLGAGLSPVATAVVTHTLLEEQGTMWIYWMEVDASHRIPILSPWIVYTVIYVGLTVVLVALAARRIRENDQ